ncbi:nucleotidyltransferase family protein [Xylanimonas sp. McL0601]|uniref:nucleotidyltransferase family protein n=1 Tax=Xylanimonas sp. McL0601 TaxID=3414739 RepID=UPI003CF4DE18
MFQNVWNAVEGRAPGYGIKDYDVFYFDATDLSWAAEDRVIVAADALFSDLEVTVQVRNEARVHLWYEEKFGTPAAPFTSAADAIDAFASTTCCVGITRDEAGLRVHAPYGLADGFAMHMRPHRRLAPRRVYETKVREYRSRWPSLTSDPW